MYINQVHINSESPVMVMLVGLPGSGKSTLARNIYCKVNGKFEAISHIHSSDKIREMLYGDENIQGDSNVVFRTLHNNIKEDLRNGHSVIYDATNIKRKNRISFLNELKNINCTKVAVVVATPVAICVERNNNRTRKVPDEVIYKMLSSYCPPHKSEGFDEVKHVFTSLEELKIWEALDMADTFDQHNSHHTLTLGGHLMKTADYLRNCKEDGNLYLAGWLHDIGKLFTQSKVDSKGHVSDDYHYYNHEHVGAYYVMFMLKNNKYHISDEDISDITNLIAYHMYPYTAWKNSEKSKQRDLEILGVEDFNRIMKLHEADSQAH